MNRQQIGYMEELKEQAEGMVCELRDIDDTHFIRGRLSLVVEAMEEWLAKHSRQGYRVDVSVRVQVPVYVWAEDQDAAERLARDWAENTLDDCISGSAFTLGGEIDAVEIEDTTPDRDCTADYNDVAQPEEEDA